MKILKFATFVSLITASVFIAPNYINSIASANEQISKISKKCITQNNVIKSQEIWGNAVVAIGKAYKSGGNYKALATTIVDNLYAYDEGPVLFKPTLASEQQFRNKEEEAVSYFVKGMLSEDKGFALKPWSKVRFENIGISISCNNAVTMGNYYFTDANTGKETKVEYTFGYVLNKDGMIRINVHHSSLPFNPEK